MIKQFYCPNCKKRLVLRKKELVEYTSVITHMNPEDGVILNEYSHDIQNNESLYCTHCKFEFYNYSPRIPISTKFKKEFPKFVVEKEE